jgi:protein-S-isoprenylcysteine O-methyltransferase Ste14
MKEQLPAILDILTMLAVLLISLHVELRFSVPQETARAVGSVIVYIGASLMIWAAVYNKGAVLGEVRPELDVLVRGGPYRFVCHPLYLGKTIALLGGAVALRSWPGMLAVFLLFLPSEIYLARVEEKALARKFGSEWENYAAQTPFFVPFIGR